MSKNGTRRSLCVAPTVLGKEVFPSLCESCSGCDGVGELLVAEADCDASLLVAFRLEPNTEAAAARSGASRTPSGIDDELPCPSDDRRVRGRAGDVGGLVPRAVAASPSGDVDICEEF